MTEPYEELKAWYEMESGTKITDEDAREVASNLLQFFSILAHWKTNSEGDSNAEPDDKTPVSE